MTLLILYGYKYLCIKLGAMTVGSLSMSEIHEISVAKSNEKDLRWIFLMCYFKCDENIVPC